MLIANGKDWRDCIRQGGRNAVLPSNPQDSRPSANFRQFATLRQLLGWAATACRQE